MVQATTLSNNRAAPAPGQPRPLSDKFFGGMSKVFGGVKNVAGKVFEKVSDHQDQILGVLRWVLSHTPEIAVGVLAFSGIMVDPVILYLIYQLGSKSRDMFNKNTGYDVSFFDQVLAMMEGYTTQVKDEDAKKALAKARAANQGILTDGSNNLLSQKMLNEGYV